MGTALLIVLSTGKHKLADLLKIEFVAHCSLLRDHCITLLLESIYVGTSVHRFVLGRVGGS